MDKRHLASDHMDRAINALTADLERIIEHVGILGQYRIEATDKAIVRNLAHHAVAVIAVDPLLSRVTMDGFRSGGEVFDAIAELACDTPLFTKLAAEPLPEPEELLDADSLDSADLDEVGLVVGDFPGWVLARAAATAEAVSISGWTAQGSTARY